MEIEEAREEIDRLDREILEKIAERMRLAREIGKEKNGLGVPVLDRDREEEVIDSVRELAAERGMDADDAEEVFRKIIRMCREAEE